ncbi:hypothetical protein DMUE_3528 [Dictyocoela muelleri]|nr:hypothetical protein DMUE_3528 [Dictyocoela muelleri]
MKPIELQQKIEKMNNLEFVNFLFDNNYLNKEYFCLKCNHSCSLRCYKRNSDLYAWRCLNKNCINYKKYISIRVNSFFENLNLPLKEIFKIVLCYIARMPRYSIINFFNFSKKTILKTIDKIIDRIPDPDFSSDKMGGAGKIVQVDETMLNYKAKSHRGRSPSNKTDAICIIEFENNIKRVFATVIENKDEFTLVPIICSQVAANSIIWTDENRAYNNLKDFFNDHGTVCHKYSFINYDNGVNTQAVECFNNLLKKEIKSRMGVKTEKRSDFLKEVCYYYNNKNDFMNKVLNLIKISF